MNLQDLSFQYSKHNHYRFGWGTDETEWFNTTDYTQPWKMTIGRCTRPFGSFRDECIQAAKDLCSQVDKHVYVGLSGGVDSQVVCLSFMEAGIPFTPCIVVMGNDYNIHDIRNADTFCNKFGLVPMYFEMDVVEYCVSFCEPIIKQHNFSNLRTLAQLWLQSKIPDGLFIMGGGDVQLSRYIIEYDNTVEIHNSDSYNYTDCCWKNGPTPILQHLIQNKLYGTTKFFMFSPELIASIICSNEVKSFVQIQDALFSPSFVQRKYYWKLYNNIAKTMLYRNNFPELIVKPKYHGFETIEKDPYFLRLKKTVIQENLNLNSEKVIMLDYYELYEYFTTEGEQKIWYSNKPEKKYSDVREFVKNIFQSIDNN